MFMLQFKTKLQASSSGVLSSRGAGRAPLGPLLPGTCSAHDLCDAEACSLWPRLSWRNSEGNRALRTPRGTGGQRQEGDSDDGGGRARP